MEVSWISFVVFKALKITFISINNVPTLGNLLAWLWTHCDNVSATTKEREISEKDYNKVCSVAASDCITQFPQKMPLSTYQMSIQISILIVQTCRIRSLKIDIFLPIDQLHLLGLCDVMESPETAPGLTLARKFYTFVSERIYVFVRQ